MAIEPTVGRIVWYRPGHEDVIEVVDGEPLAADVCRVWPDGRVTLCVKDAKGAVHSRERVQLVQDGEEPPARSYCEWMPYQIGQAKNHAEPQTPETDFAPEVSEQAVPDDVPVTESPGDQRPFRKRK